MQLAFLKHIISSIAGHNAAGVVDILYGKKNVSEALIAKKLRLTINQTRNILYRLADGGLVSFVRKKNSKKGGWYDYFWTLNSGKGLLKFKERLENNLEHLKQQRDYRKGGRFFFCSVCELEFAEEQALANNYTCPECGSVLTLKDTSAELVQLDKEIKKLQDVLANVKQEVEIISAQEQEARERKLLAVQRKQAKLRAAQRAAMKKAAKRAQAKQKKKKKAGKIIRKKHKSSKKHKARRYK